MDAQDSSETWYISTRLRGVTLQKTVFFVYIIIVHCSIWNQMRRNICGWYLRISREYLDLRVKDRSNRKVEKIAYCGAS